MIVSRGIVGSIRRGVWIVQRVLDFCVTCWLVITDLGRVVQVTRFFCNLYVFGLEVVGSGIIGSFVLLTIVCLGSVFGY